MLWFSLAVNKWFGKESIYRLATSILSIKHGFHFFLGPLRSTPKIENPCSQNNPSLTQHWEGRGGGGVGGVYYAYETWKRRININNKKEKKLSQFTTNFSWINLSFTGILCLLKLVCVFADDRLINNGAYSVKFWPLCIYTEVHDVSERICVNFKVIIQLSVY